MTRKIFTSLFMVFICLSLTACTTKEDVKVKEDVKIENEENIEEEKSLKFGGMALTEPILEFLKEGMEEKGYDIEIVTFDGNHLPAVALTENNIDGLVLNYLPWLETFNEENDSDLYMVEPHLYFGFSALFSEKYNDVNELPENAQVAISGDPTNLEAALLGLEDAGLITLGEKTGEFYSKVDIIDNPKNLELLETEVTQTARYIDEVDLVSIDSGTAAEAGIDTSTYIYPDKKLIEDEMNSQGEDKEKKEDSLFIDPDFGLIIQGNEKESKWVEDAIDVYLSDAFREKFNEHYKGAYILYSK